MTLTIDDLIQDLIANNNGKKDELITTIEKSANYGYKVAVDKACEWLTRELCYTARGINLFNNKTATDEFVESFKKNMKGD